MSDQFPLTAIIAPCGLNCGKCVAYENGAIHKHSQAILGLLGPDFDAYAERLANMEPSFKAWPALKNLFLFLSRGQCGGCRKSGCLFSACGVHPCVKEKKVNFCFECTEFPCTRHGLTPSLEKRWRQNNETMKQVGVESYWEKIKNLPRYP